MSPDPTGTPVPAQPAAPRQKEHATMAAATTPNQSIAGTVSA